MVHGSNGSHAGEGRTKLYESHNVSRVLSVQDKVVSIAREAGKKATYIKHGWGFAGPYDNANDDLLPNQFFSNRPDAKGPVPQVGRQHQDDDDDKLIASQNASGLKWKLLEIFEEPANFYPLDNEALAHALSLQTEFTQQEWDDFGVKDLRMQHCIKSGDSYFKPAESALASALVQLAAAQNALRESEAINRCVGFIYITYTHHALTRASTHTRPRTCRMYLYLLLHTYRYMRHCGFTSAVHLI